MPLIHEWDKRGVMKSYGYLLVLALSVVLTAGPASAAGRPVVVELFTSHGCSSCPQADAYLKEFSQNDPSVLPLSFHVTYWDYLGFKDPYAMQESTSRQRNYAQISGHRNVFTPQVVVDGIYSAVGNDHEDFNNAIRLAKTTRPTVPITISSDRYDVHVHIAERQEGDMAVPSGGVVWLVYYDKNSVTAVDAGENSGKTLENINNVIGIKRLGFWHNTKATYNIPRKQLAGDGMAIILQSSPQNQIMGAATYEDYNS